MALDWGRKRLECATEREDIAPMKTAQPAGSPGYTFPLMLIIVASMAYGAMRLDAAQSYRMKRDKEAELLFRGLAYKRAIKEFFLKNKRYPRALAELANDRDPSKIRFIRQLYKDPMTGGDFRPILLPEGAITGVLSPSKGKPFKAADFDKDLEDFDKAETYAGWKFDAGGAVAQGPGAGAPAAPQQNPPPCQNNGNSL